MSQIVTTVYRLKYEHIWYPPDSGEPKWISTTKGFRDFKNANDHATYKIQVGAIRNARLEVVEERITDVLTYEAVS